MIKVGHVVTAYSSAVSILAPKLSALDAYDDLSVTVVTGPRPTNRELGDPPVRHVSVAMVRPIRPMSDLRAVGQLAKVFRREGFDVVHSHTSKAGILATLAARRARVPVVLHTYHGMAYFEGQPRRLYHTYRTIERIACRFRDHVFSQNRRDLAECAALMGSADRVSYEGNGVNAEAVRSQARAEAERAAGDFPPGEGVRIVLVSRLEAVKRVDMFLRMCGRLKEEGLDFSAVVAGQGPLEGALRAEAARRGVANRVRLVGWSPYASALLALGDVVALTSEKEGIPRALMEAMALCKPIVATDVPGTQELVRNGETGFLTPLDDAEEMARKVSVLAHDDALRQRMGEAGRRRVEAEFNDVKIAAFLREYYLRACAPRSAS